MREVAKQALIGQSPDKPVTTVSRPNWLKVIVGRLNERFVVVLVSDVSETVRFSQIRDSFITNVSEQLLKPTQSLEELADALEHDSDNKAAIEGNTVKLRQSCAYQGAGTDSADGEQPYQRHGTGENRRRRASRHGATARHRH